MNQERIMSWLIDSANTWYLLLGIVGLGFGTAWWMNRRAKYLLGVAAAAALIALLWLLTRLVVTERQQLELNVRAMAEAVVEGKADVLLNYFAGDFEFQGRKRKDLADGVVRGAKQFQVTEIVISAFDVEELKDLRATVFFRATVRHRGEDRPYLVACRASFVKENERWRVREVRFYNPLVNQNQPIALPIP
jgi:hypothetical protein